MYLQCQLVKLVMSMKCRLQNDAIKAKACACDTCEENQLSQFVQTPGRFMQYLIVY